MSKRPKITTTTTRKGEKPPSSLYHIYGYRDYNHQMIIIIIQLDIVNVCMYIFLNLKIEKKFKI